MIPSVASAQLYKTKILHIKHDYNDFIKRKVFELVNKIIIDKIIEKMRNLGFSEKIINNTYLHKNIKVTPDKIQFRIISDYESETHFDVGLAREFGTRDHKIEPKIKQSLSWIQEGKRKFSKGHQVSGLPEHKVITNTIREELPFLKIRLREETQKWVKSIIQ